MSEQAKCCGTCRWWFGHEGKLRGHYRDHPRKLIGIADCNAPLPASQSRHGHYRNKMTADGGDDCPCHAPKDVSEAKGSGVD